jgi:tRNA U34 5-methylaminomethyl-2-thiouridine-forming methyltransferase MnmC
VTQLIWRDGLPYSETYDDIYHARAGAYAQAEAVFISGNDIKLSVLVMNFKS